MMSDQPNLQANPNGDVATYRLRIFGMQRSGNHAIISWLRRNMGLDNGVFFNQCQPGDPLQSFLSIEIGANQRKTRQQFEGQICNLRETVHKFSNIVVSYENEHLSISLGRPIFTWLRPEKTNWQTVSIHRSFASWLASFYKLHVLIGTPASRNNRSATFVGPYLLLYKDQLQRSKLNDVVSIDYDRWLTDQTYRSEQLAALGIPVCDNSIGTRANYGPGSSFDGLVPDINVENQLKRWVSLTDDVGFRTLFGLASCDDELRACVKEKYPDDAALMDHVHSGEDLRDLLYQGTENL